MLTATQEAKIQKVASSGLCGFLRGAANVLDYTGTGVHLATGLAGSGLHLVANGIETVGEKTDSVLTGTAESMRAKADEFDISDVDEEELAKAIQAEQDKQARDVVQGVVA